MIIKLWLKGKEKREKGGGKKETGKSPTLMAGLRSRDARFFPSRSLKATNQGSALPYRRRYERIDL